MNLINNKYNYWIYLDAVQYIYNISRRLGVLEILKSSWFELQSKL